MRLHLITMDGALWRELDGAREELLESWRKRVTGVIAPQGRASEVLNGLPLLLEAMIASLRAQTEGRGPAADEAALVGSEHGAQRFKAGFSLGTVVREYGVLRECLFDFVRERGLSPTLDELQLVMKVVNVAIATAVEQYSHERDQAIQRQSDEHFAFLAHELRNPLASAMMATEVIGRHLADPKHRGWDRLRRSLERINAMVDHTLAEVRLRSAGHMPELHLDTVRLDHIVADAVAEAQGHAEDRDITVVVASDVPVSIRGDRRLLDSVVHNLLRNGIKFTHHGGTVQVRVHAGEGLASVEVQDQCGGLPDGSPQDLFTPFVQRGADRTGYGLGLAIVKQAVEAHGGTVQVSNLPDKGCIFMFSVPLEG